MTIVLRRSGDRAHVSEGDGGRWTTFVPADQGDPLWCGFRVLESFVEYDLAPGMGLLVHAHKDNERVTYVEEGAVIHGDSVGRTGRLRAGEFRRTSTPAGMFDSAINKSRTDRAHVFQSGIASHPDSPRPGGEQKLFPLAERRGILRLVASPDGRDGSLRVHQDVRMYSSLLDRGTPLIHALEVGRRAWLHVVAGRIQLGEHRLSVGDGVGLADEVAVSFTAQEPSEILLFDLP